MGATNTTANLELSQFVGSDKPDWLTDYNGDMLKIDGAYGAVSATAEEAAANAESAAASATQAAADAAEALSGISGAIDAAAAAQTAAEQATSVSTSALTVANGAAATAQSAAGDAQQALQVANNAKVTAENAQAAAASAQQAATAAAADAAASAAIASGVDSRITAIENCVPTGASSSDKFAVASDVTAVGNRVTSIENCVPSGASSSDKFAIESEITAITDLIPATASSSNKLATMADITGGVGYKDYTVASFSENMRSELWAAISGSGYENILRVDLIQYSNAASKFYYPFNIANKDNTSAFLYRMLMKDYFSDISNAKLCEQYLRAGSGGIDANIEINGSTASDMGTTVQQVFLALSGGGSLTNLIIRVWGV